MSGQVKVKSLSIFIVVCIPLYDIISWKRWKSYDETPRKPAPVCGLLLPSAGGRWTDIFFKGHKWRSEDFPRKIRTMTVKQVYVFFNSFSFSLVS